MSTSMKSLASLLKEIYGTEEMSPEEFAARNSYTLYMFASHLQHGDPELDRWFREVERILGDQKLLKRARKKFLSPGEILEIEALLEDEFY